MSPSPRIQPTFSLDPWQNNSCSLPPKKWTVGPQDTKIITKMMPSQKSSIIFDKKLIVLKTQPKFYQKTHKKMQNPIYKQKIQSIKPIRLHQYDQNKLIIEPNSKRTIQKDQHNSQNSNNLASTQHTACIGLINPMYINVKCNPKRMVNSCQLVKQKQLQNQINLKNMNRTHKKMSQTNSVDPESNQSSPSPVKKQNQTDVLYFRIVSEMNDYFNSMKLMSFKNNKTQQIARRSIKSHSEKRDFKDFKRQPKHLLNNDNLNNRDDNLNIVGLRPISSDYQRINRTSHANFSKSLLKQSKQKESLSTSKFYQSQLLTPQTEQKSQLTLHLSKITPRYDGFNFQSNVTSMIICNEIVVSPMPRMNKKRPVTNMRPLTNDIKRSFSPGVKKNKYKGFCFGEINNPKNSTEQIYRLKVLYYKDLLWKNCFNLGIKYSSVKSEESNNLKYFVGKGNNSKLIKTLMAKRWWWSLDTKEQNSNFVWTQLKIYSIYEKQPNLSQQSQNPQLSDQSTQPISLFNSTVIQSKLLQQKTFIDNSVLIMNEYKKKFWENYINSHQNQEKQKKITQENLSLMRKKLQKNISQIKTLQSPSKITNHLEFSRIIGNKKALYKVMMLYLEKVKRCSPDQIFVPLTYHITAGLQDQEYLKFLTEYYRRNKALNKTCWIVKPGQLTNRGRGIQYCKDLKEIKPIVKKKQTHPNGSLKTFLIQQYLDRPLLYKGRKFDIRHYIMISSINGKLRGYFYHGGYIRTTSYKYKLDDNSPAIHLTNDAVQKYCKDYGKYEKGNKLSYEEFDEYMQEKYPSEDDNKKIGFFSTIHPQIRKISTDVMNAAYYFIDPKRKVNNFQIFGLDIMVDQSLKCYLIEVNTNPCLQLSSPVLKNVIPDMLDNAFALTLDCCFPPPEKQPLHQYHKKHKYPISPENKFKLVFDEDIDGKKIEECYKKEGIEPNQLSGIGDDDQNFESCEEDNEDQ